MAGSHTVHPKRNCHTLQIAEYLDGRRANKARTTRMQAKASIAKLAAKSRKQEQGSTEEGLALQEHSTRGSAAKQAQQVLPSLGAAARVHAFVQRTWLTRPLATFLTPTGNTNAACRHSSPCGSTASSIGACAWPAKPFLCTAATLK